MAELTTSTERREARTEKFRAKNARRKVARSDRFGSLPARRIRRTLGGSFGRCTDVRGEMATGSLVTSNPHAYTYDGARKGQW